VFWICVLACICVSLFCVFIVRYSSTAPSEDIVKFRYRVGEAIHPLAHMFVKFFQFLYSFSCFEIFSVFLNWFFICS